MKLISWNVNGLRSVMKKGFLDFVAEHDPDIFCMQETRWQTPELDLALANYNHYWNHAEKKGYSGTAIFTKKKPLNIIIGLNIDNVKCGRRIAREVLDF